MVVLILRGTKYKRTPRVWEGAWDSPSDLYIKLTDVQLIEPLHVRHLGEDIL